MQPNELIGTLWKQEAEPTPYRAQNMRVNVASQVHEVGLKRLDTADVPGVGYVWLDPQVLVQGEGGWEPADQPAVDAIANFGPKPSVNVMRQAALEALSRSSEVQDRDPRLARLSLGELVNRGAAYVLEIEAVFNEERGRDGAVSEPPEVVGPVAGPEPAEQPAAVEAPAAPADAAAPSP